MTCCHKHTKYTDTVYSQVTVIQHSKFSLRVFTMAAKKKILQKGKTMAAEMGKRECVYLTVRKRECVCAV